MLVGMIYMFFAMTFEGEWIPRGAWMILYAAISIAILVLMMIRFRQRGSLSKMWILALVQQASMVYMCYSPMHWIPIATYALVLYFAFEAFTSLIAAPIGAPASGAAPTLLLRWPDANRLCMFVMAASMGYMFLGMQLKSISRESERLALQKKLESIEGGSGIDAADGPSLSPSLAAASFVPARPPQSANEPSKLTAQPEQVAGTSVHEAAPQVEDHSPRLQRADHSRGHARRPNKSRGRRHWPYRR